jgi:hypothetical protein
MHIGATAMENRMTAFAFAHPFMEAAGDVIMAWQLLWRATIAAEKLENGAKKKDVPFYEGILKSADFFTGSVLPVTFGKMKSILNTNTAAVDISADAFAAK